MAGSVRSAVGSINYSNNDKSVYALKITESAAKQISNYLKSEVHGDKLSIKFQSNGDGVISIPSCNGYGKHKDFSIRAQKNDDNSHNVVETLCRNRRNQYSCLGEAYNSYRMQGDVSSYDIAKNKITTAKALNEKNCTKELKQNGVVNRRHLNGGGGGGATDFASQAIKAMSDEPPPEQGYKYNQQLSARPMRERIIHILATGTWSRLSLMKRIREEGCNHKDKANILHIIKSCGNFVHKNEKNDDVFKLKRSLWSSVDEKWDYYTPDEIRLMLENKQKFADEDTSSQSPKNMLTDLSTIDPTAKKARSAGGNRLYSGVKPTSTVNSFSSLSSQQKKPQSGGRGEPPASHRMHPSNLLDTNGDKKSHSNGVNGSQYYNSHLSSQYSNNNNITKRESQNNNSSYNPLLHKLSPGSRSASVSPLGSSPNPNGNGVPPKMNAVNGHSNGDTKTNGVPNGHRQSNGWSQQRHSPHFNNNNNNNNNGNGIRNGNNTGSNRPPGRKPDHRNGLINGHSKPSVRSPADQRNGLTNGHSKPSVRSPADYHNGLTNGHSKPSVRSPADQRNGLTNGHSKPSVRSPADYHNGLTNGHSKPSVRSPADYHNGLTNGHSKPSVRSPPVATPEVSPPTRNGGVRHGTKRKRSPSPVKKQPIDVDTYKEKYGMIGSLEERRVYRSDFEDGYREYVEMHKELENDFEPIYKLREQMKRVPQDSMEYEHLQERVRQIYEHLPQDTNDRRNYYHKITAALEHIKWRVSQYDTAVAESRLESLNNSLLES